MTVALQGAPSTSASQPHILPHTGEFENVGILLSKDHKSFEWTLWKTSLRIHLRSRKLDEITYGQEITPPAFDLKSSNYDVWREKDEAAKDQIIGNISDDLVIVLRAETTASGIWKKLVEVFEAPDRTKKGLLIQRYKGLRYVDGSSMRSYIIKLDATRRELGEHQIHVSDEHHAARLSCYLPKSWEQIAFLCRSSSKSPSVVKRILLAEEETRVLRGISPDVTVNARPQEQNAPPQHPSPPPHTPQQSSATAPVPVPTTAPSVSDESGSEEPSEEPSRGPSRARSRGRRRRNRNPQPHGSMTCNYCGRNGHRQSTCRALRGARQFLSS